MNIGGLRELIRECITEIFIERGGDTHERSGEALKVASSLWSDVYHVEFHDKDEREGIKYKVLVGGPRNLVGFIKQDPKGHWFAFNQKGPSWIPVDIALQEMSMTQGGPGGEGYLTKYAFSRRELGNPEAAETLGYKIVDKNKKKKSSNYA